MLARSEGIPALMWIPVSIAQSGRWPEGRKFVVYTSDPGPHGEEGGLYVMAPIYLDEFTIHQEVDDPVYASEGEPTWMRISKYYN